MDQPSLAMPDLRRRWLLAIAAVAALFLVLVALRIAGASDLYHNRDQTKTMAYTTDMVRNGRFALPRDNTGSFARKPPLVNWIGAPVQAAGFWSEWAFKLPSILAAAFATGVVVWFAHRQLIRCRPEHALRLHGGEASDEERPTWDATLKLVAIGAAAAAGAMYLANVSTTKHVYFLRPNMLNAAVMALAWASATIAIDPATRKPFRWALTFWLATVATALSIGPTAFENLLYAALAPFVIGAGWRSVRRLGWHWGLPLTLVLVGAWLYAAYRSAPEFVVHELIGIETVERVVDSDAADPYWLMVLRSAWRVPGYFMERLFPWSIPAAAAIVAIALRPRRWKTHPMAPAALWVICVMLVLLPVASKGGSFTMPAYPAGAVLAAYALCRTTGWFKLRAGHVFAAAALLMILFAALKGFATEQAVSDAGERVKRFARQVQPIIGDEPVIFTDLNPEAEGFAALPSLLGRHQAGPPTEAQRRAAVWHITSIPPDGAPDDAVAVSELLDRYPDDDFKGVRYILKRHSPAPTTP